MSRLVRFLIITLTLGRIKWLMRLTWLWRFIVFLGITGGIARLLRRAIGFDKKPATEIDSAWAEALRYTPQAASPASPFEFRPAGSTSQSQVSEATSEVTGVAADGEVETITIHEVDLDGETESIVRIEDDSGNVETLVTGAPAEEIDLVNLGASATESEEPVAEPPVVEEIMLEIPAMDTEELEIIAETEELEVIAETEVIELIETLEAAEPEPEPASEPKPPRRKRAPKAEPVAETVPEPQEEIVEEPAPELLVDPDWVRGDGSLDCPVSHPVKAKANSMIFYVPESGHYDRTIPDVCFASELDAESAGYRPPRR